MALNPLFQSGPLDPDGTPQVSPEAGSLLLDGFDGTLATNWTAAAVSSGTAPTASGSVLTFGSSTTASQGSVIRTNLTFLARASAYLKSSQHVLVQAATQTNVTQWWGIGTNQSAPTAANPVLNGAVFLTDYADGALKAVTFSAGTRTVVATLTRPTDAAYHKYEVYYRQSRVDWVIDGIAVASVSQPSFGAFQSPYLVGGQQNYTTAPSAAPTMRWGGASISDTGANAKTIGDGVNPTVQATVKAPSSASAATDSPLVVALHPSSGTPALAAGTSRIGAVDVGAVTRSASYTTSTTTNAAVVAKSSTGSVQALLISNTSTAAQWVKLYNATAVTLGTTAAIVDIPVAAGAHLTLPLSVNGAHFTVGIAYAVTGAVGATNNTAGAGGVLVALTYV